MKRVNVCKNNSITMLEREYRSFYMIKELYHRYLVTVDILLQKRNSINCVNIIDFTYNEKNL